MALGTVFLSNVLLSFGLSLFVAGLFGAYFSSGRGRSVGFVLALVALLLVGLFAALTWQLVPGVQPVFDAAIITQSMVAVIAALLGTILAVTVFVGSVMKS